MTKKQKQKEKEVEQVEKKVAEGLEDVNEELEECKKLKDEYLDNWKRERAAFLNYKKDGTQRITSLTQYINMNMILKFIPILDNLSLAEKSLSEDSKKDSNIEGFLQIKRQIESFLEGEGVSIIESVNEKFDPNFHEVVGVVDKEDVESGIIIEEIQRGYKIKGQLLRPAKVKVSK